MTEDHSHSSPDEAAAEAAIFALMARPDAPRTIAPEEAARALAVDSNWQAVLPLVKRTAIRLAREGRLAVYRKGKPIDPDELRGVYRLGAPAARSTHEEDGKGAAPEV